MQTTVNGHNEAPIEVTVNPIVPAQDNTQALLDLIARMDAKISAIESAQVNKPAEKQSKKSVEKPRALYKPHASEEKFDGKPMITLFAEADGRPFSFGVKKARLILALLPAIKAFAEKHDSENKFNF